MWNGFEQGDNIFVKITKEIVEAIRKLFGGKWGDGMSSTPTPKQTRPSSSGWWAQARRPEQDWRF